MTPTFEVNKEEITNNAVDAEIQDEWLQQTTPRELGYAPSVTKSTLNIEQGEVLDTEYESLLSELLSIREDLDTKSWRVGDIAVKFIDRYGKKAMKGFAKQGGLKVNTMRRYMQVAREFTPAVREEFKLLSWTHFRIVVNKDNKYELLIKAADENWSTEKMELAAKPPKELANGQFIEDGLPIPPQPRMVLCMGCRKWYFEDEDAITSLCNMRSVHIGMSNQEVL